MSPMPTGPCSRGLTDSETQILVRTGQLPIFPHPAPKPQSLTVNQKHQCHAGARLHRLAPFYNEEMEASRGHFII